MEANFERDSLRQSVTVLEAILSRAFDQYYLHFNHLLYPLFAVICCPIPVEGLTDMCAPRLH